MKKESVIRVSIIFLFLFLMLLPYMLRSYNVTNFSIVDVSENNVPKMGGSFVITSLNYVINGNDLEISYSLKDESGFVQELTAKYVLRDLEGDKIAEGQQNIVLEAGKETSYKAVLHSPYEIKGFLRLALSVSNGTGTELLIKDVDNSKSYVTGLTIGEVASKSAGFIGIGILILVVYLVYIYLYRHNARVKNVFVTEEKVFIPLDLGSKKKRR